MPLDSNDTLGISSGPREGTSPCDLGASRRGSCAQRFFSVEGGGSGIAGCVCGAAGLGRGGGKGEVALI